MPSSSFAPPSQARLRRKTLTPSDPVFRDQIINRGHLAAIQRLYDNTQTAQAVTEFVIQFPCKEKVGYD